MSSVLSPAAALVNTGEHGPATELNAPSRKSYRRKYRKIMVKFEDRMRESNGLFKDEQRIFDISRRLAEQTDQILDLLTELNECPQIPKHLRYDLTPASIPPEMPQRMEYQDIHSVHEMLRVERYRVQKGETTPYEYEGMCKKLLNTAEFAPTKSYAALIRSTTIARSTHESPNETTVPMAIGTLTTKQEEQYQQSLDAFVAHKSANPRAHVANSLGSRSAERTTDREREMQLKNPVSVYNWLRKHQPQVFLQDHESTADKAGKTSTSRGSKRNPAGKDVKQEPDLYDEDGFAADQGASSKGKRKRDEDGAFRPKGGRSSHVSKRRKEDGSGNGKKVSKRPSIDTRNS